MEDFRHDKKKDCMEDFLKKLPPNYPMGGVYLNGATVPVASFSNVCGCLAYFIDGEGQMVVLDTGKVDGVAFGAAEEPEEPEVD